MALSTKRKIEFRTSASGVVPVALDGERYWYDAGDTANGEPVYYDNSTGTYARWYNGEYWFITSKTDVDNLQSDYFLLVPETIIGSGGDDSDTDGIYSISGVENGRCKWSNGI